MIGRSSTFVFAVLVVALGCAAGLDVSLNGRFTVFNPTLLSVLTVVGLGFLLHHLLLTRHYARNLEERTDRLTSLAAELEHFITALEAANARLKASEARYKGLVDAQGDAIMRRTADGRMTYANETFFRLFGLRPEEAIGQVFRPQLHPQSPPPFFGRLAGREMGRERVSYDHHVKTVAGYRWIAWEDYAIRDGSGRLIEIQSVGRDITERKALEAALTEARDKAELANRAKSRFLATMSHEIRTPMNGVLGMARLLLETPLAPDQRTYAEAIRQSGLALLALIEDILDFSKIESGALVVESGEVAIRPLLEGISELLSTRAHAKGIEIATAIAADVPTVIRTDSVRFRQIVTNLVGNAIKFTEDGGVLVSANVEWRKACDSGRDELWLSLGVRDTGIGVPEEKTSQIFEEFVQADSSQARRFEGSGLGLAISKRLVKAMGGDIGVRPAEGRGSIFWVCLPIEGSPNKSARRPLKGKRVGLFCRSHILRQGLRLQLSAAGCEVLEVKTLDAVKTSRPTCDLLLVDGGINENDPLPDVRVPGVPSVVLLSPSQRGRLTSLSDQGFKGFLTKPVRQESLEKRLAAVIAGEPSLAVAAQPQPTASPSSRHLSVLLAEDNPVNALLARELLRRRGHRVTEVGDGDAAVAACAAARFDIVIMDLHMPGLDGIEATRRIRLAEKASGAKPVPVIALTADALETGRKACLEAGMDGFLTKPVDPQELDDVLASVHSPAVEAAE